MADQKSEFAVLNLIYSRTCPCEIECEQSVTRLRSRHVEPLLFR